MVDCPTIWRRRSVDPGDIDPALCDGSGLHRDPVASVSTRLAARNRDGPAALALESRRQRGGNSGARSLGAPGPLVARGRRIASRRRIFSRRRLGPPSFAGGSDAAARSDRRARRDVRRRGGCRPGSGGGPWRHAGAGARRRARVRRRGHRRRLDETREPAKQPRGRLKLAVAFAPPNRYIRREIYYNDGAQSARPARHWETTP
jgi:hypothetical protein